MSQTTTTTSVSRASVLQLGKSGKPWAFLAMMRQIGSATDGEPAIVFAHAANLAKLGLKELAAERLRILPPAVKAMAEVKGLADAIEAMGSARVIQEELLRNFDASGRVIVARGVAAESDVVRWRGFLEEAIGKTPVYRATDGNVVIAGVMEEDAKAGAFELIASEGKEEYPAALLVENLLPPWLLLEAAERWKKNAQGFWRRLMVVHEDDGTIGLGLGLADVSGVLGQERVKVFAGAGALEGVKKFVHEHRDEMLVARLVSLREAQGSDTILANIIIQGTDAQLEELKELKERAEQRYAVRDKAFWAQRYREAMNGGKPLRVLVPTTRYSTFLQHSSRDIVDAFKAIGHEAKLLIEPEDCSTLAANAYWRAFDEFDPDLVVLINFPRPMRESTTPANIPYVTWLQDAMLHLFEPSLEKKLGELDFACGYLFNDCYLKGNWDRKQAVAAPVAINPRKFFNEPVLGFEHLVCDVAFVSNHSETPEQMRKRLAAVIATRGISTSCINDIDALIEETVRQSHLRSLWTELPPALDQILQRHGVAGDAVTMITHTYVTPMAGQIFRDEALRWTHEICRHRDWTFHLYGRGWDKHPILAQHARGPIAHGEELRAAYQKAGAHLHLDLNLIMHQRVAECILAGGFIVSRLFADAIDADATRAARAMASVPCDTVSTDGRPAWITRNHAPFREHEQLRASLGLGPRYPGELWARDPEFFENFAFIPQSLGMDPTFVLGNLKELTFVDAPTLEAVLEKRLVANSGAAPPPQNGTLMRIHQHMIHDAICKDVIEKIAARLSMASG